jgi:hypothetical protein
VHGRIGASAQEDASGVGGSEGASGGNPSATGGDGKGCGRAPDEAHDDAAIAATSMSVAATLWRQGFRPADRPFMFTFIGEYVTVKESAGSCGLHRFYGAIA